MSHESRAWFLYEGRPDERPGELAELRQETFTVPDPGPGEVLAESLYCSWEGNYHHALTREPVDVCKRRGEPRIVLGNAGVVRVLKVGEGVTGVRAGDAAMIHGAGRWDRFGYMTHALAYDAPGTMGCLATRIVIPARCAIPLPADTRHSLAQWAAFSVRYATAWSNWELALGTFRLQIPEAALPVLHVWGWGGGTTLAELDLARRQGHRCVMLSGDPRRLATIESTGLAPLDRRAFPALTDEAASADQRRAAEKKFVAEVVARTHGDRVQIFLDYIGTTTLAATLAALGRCGVLATAGWKRGGDVHLRRALECILRRQQVHTHFASRAQHEAAMHYGEAHGWVPILDEPITPFAEVPTLARRFAAGETGFFPVFAVSPE